MSIVYVECDACGDEIECEVKLDAACNQLITTVTVECECTLVAEEKIDELTGETDNLEREKTKLEVRISELEVDLEKAQDELAANGL